MFLKRLISLFTILFLAVINIPIPAAAETGAMINDQIVSNGDTVDYSVHAIDCPLTVSAVDISVYYDSDSLEYVKDSLSTPGLENAVTNSDLPGEIRLNALSLKGFNFSEDTVLAEMKFKVIDDSNASINLNYSVKSFLDNEKNDLKDSYTYDMIAADNSSSSYIENIDDAVNSSAAASESGSKAAASVNPKDSDSKTDSKVNGSQSAASETVSYSDTASLLEKNSRSSDAKNDIPSDKAILLDTVDTPVNVSSNNKTYYLILLCGVGIVILIGIIFRILVKDSNED